MKSIYSLKAQAILPWHEVSGQQIGRLDRTPTLLSIDDRIRHLKNDISIYTKVGDIYRPIGCLGRLIPLLMENIIKKHCKC